MPETTRRPVPISETTIAAMRAARTRFDQRLARNLSQTPISPTVLQAVTAEAVRAIAKHGLTHSPINPDTPPGEALAMLTEEVGEVAHALTYDADPAALEGELVQVAAVALMWLQARHDTGGQDPARAADQAWYQAPDWQAGEREATAQIAAGALPVYDDMTALLADIGGDPDTPA
jgi:hypothetical protein